MKEALPANRLMLACASLFFVSAHVAAADEGLPKLSRKHGIYSSATTLRVYPSVTGRTVHYTTDGSAPTMSSKVLKAGLSISETTIVRIAEEVDDTTLSPTVTYSYIYPSSVLKQGNKPEGYPTTWGTFTTISGTAPAYYAMDEQLVSEYSDHITASFSELPIASIVTDKDNLFSHEIDEEWGGIYIYTGDPMGGGIGRGWERAISFELFGGRQKHDLTVDCGIKIHGGHGRLPEKNPKHAFRLVFKPQYGPKKLKYPVFGEDYGAVKFNDLVLRTFFGNAWTHWLEDNRQRAQYLRDFWARAIQERMGYPVSKGQPVHLFINGMYWGIYNLCERITADWCSAHFGGDESIYDVLKVDETNGERVTEVDGNLDAWNRMLKLTGEVSDNNDRAYNALQGLDADGNPDPTLEPLLDMQAFADYMLINYYAGNTDWDSHNWFAFRNREFPEHGFRFICWDSELIFGSVNEDVTGTDNSGKPTHILRQLMRNHNFRNLFNHRAHVLLTKGGMLTPDYVVSVWDSLYYGIDESLYAETARWGDYRRDIHPYQSKGHRYRIETYYMNERNRLLNDYFPYRTDKVIAQLRNRGWYSTADGIEGIPFDGNDSQWASTAIKAGEAIYDINGRRLYDNLQPLRDGTLTRGIYIIGGKKIIVR